MIDLVAADLAGLAPLLAWTLANFLWQGAVVALALQVVLRACRTARARHDWAVAALVLMAASPIATYAWLQANIRIVLAPAGTPGLALGSASTWELVAVAAWFAGVVALAARTAGGLILVERLRRTAAPLPAEWAARCQALQGRMAGSLRALFAQSGAIATPLVAGWIKPMVLIPAAALARLPADQLEALILHELAHVRRFDVLANLLQTAVETTLFYHPAIWWVSRRIRLEREHCCDDLAVDAIADPALYVRALQAVDALRAPPFGVMAASGGDLKRRAARVLGLAAAPTQPPLSRTAAILILTAAGGAMAHGVAVQAQPAEPPPAAEAPPRTSPPPTHPPYPVPPIERQRLFVGPRADMASAPPVEKLGPMPPDSDPAGQAAWRARSYDRQIELDRRMAEIADGALTRAKTQVAGLPETPADDPRRLRDLQMLDQWSSTKALSELHAQAAQVAKDAYARAEAVRLRVAAGKRPAADLTAARAKAVQAERMVAAALQARVDEMMVQAQATAKFADVVAKASPELNVPPMREELSKVIEVQERARLETLAYREVRDGVDAGKRPASDLEAAGRSLKAAQQTMYDLVDEMQKQNAVLQERNHQGNLERIKRYEADVATREARLATLQGEARTDAEERLRMAKEILADTKKADERSASRKITSLPHPELPILPPRS